LPGLSAFLMLFFIFHPGCLGARLFSGPLLRFLGIVSYEWFLIHQPVQVQFREFLGSSVGSIPRYLFTVFTPSLLSLGLAILIYHKFSLPILRWGRRRVSSGPLATSLPAKALSSCPQ